MKAPATAGRFAERIVDGRDDAGHEARAGVYFAQLRTGTGGLLRRVILTR